MWHYVEGLRNWDPIWENHGIRILPGPSSLWLDATGQAAPGAVLPGLRHPRHAASTCARTGYDYSWFVLTQKIIEKEFALSGSEQNPDLTGKDVRLLLGRVRPGAPGPVEAFKQHGEDFVVADTLAELVAGMNALTGERPHRRRVAARADRGPRPRDRQRLHQGRRRSPRIRGARALPRRQADPGRRPRTSCSTPRPAR